MLLSLPRMRLMPPQMLLVPLVSLVPPLMPLVPALMSPLKPPRPLVTLPLVRVLRLHEKRSCMTPHHKTEVKIQAVAALNAKKCANALADQIIDFIVYIKI
jgi:hypothetical protein